MDPCINLLSWLVCKSTHRHVTHRRLWCLVKLVKLNMGTHPTVPLQGLHQGIVGFRVKVQAFMHILEIQVFERRRRLGVFFA